MKFCSRKGSNILELLLALSILSASLYPIVYIFKMARPEAEKTQTEFLATMLAHHVIETVIASKIKNPDYLPQMSESQPIVQIDDGVQNVSDFFRFISENDEPVKNNDSNQLYWTLKQFNCQVDTYYLEGLLYKVIAYITYEHEGRQMKVFLERLLAQPALELQEENQK